MSQELDTIFPGQDVQLSNGDVLVIKPLVFGQFPKAAKLAQGIAKPLMQAYEQKSADTTQAIMQVLAEGGEDLLSLVALGVNKPRSFFDTLQFDDGVRLTRAFLEVNLDFFTQRVLPELNKLIPKAVGQN